MTHAELLKLLLPYSYDASEPVLAASLEAEASRLDEAHASAELLIGAIDPLSAWEWLVDYERLYGLPDACLGAGASIQQRLAMLASAALERGGLSAAYYEHLAKVLGWTATVREFEPFAAGAAAGSPVAGEDWRFAWALATSEPVAIKRLQAGFSAGSALASWGDAALECAMNRAKPAHTVVLVCYGGHDAQN